MSLPATSPEPPSRPLPPILRLAPAPTADPVPDQEPHHERGPQGPGGTGRSRHRPHRSGQAAAPDLPARILEAVPEAEAQFGPQPTSRAELPDPVTWARRLLQAVLEAEAGVRSPDQLSRWVTPEVRARLTRRHRLARRRARRPAHPARIGTVLATEPADGICEISASVRTEGRGRAVALRLEGLDGRWLTTVLEIG